MEGPGCQISPIPVNSDPGSLKERRGESLVSDYRLGEYLAHGLCQGKFIVIFNPTLLTRDLSAGSNKYLITHIWDYIELI